MRKKFINSDLNSGILLHATLAFAIASLSGVASQLVDGIVISRYLGETEIAAFGLVSPCYYLMAMFSGILVMGGQALVSKAMGAGEEKQIQKAVSTILICVIILSAIMTALVLLCPDVICNMFGATGDNDEILKAARQYLLGWGVGIPAAVLFAALTPLSILGGNRKILSIAVIVQTIVNCVGDVLLVSVFKKGLLGAGIATTLNFYVAAFILFAGFCRKKSTIRLKITTFDFRVLFDMIKFGLPLMMRRLCKTVFPIFANRLILVFGGTAIMAALTIQKNVNEFLMIYGIGLADSLSIIVQVLYSEKDRNGIKRSVRASARMMFVGSIVISVVVFILAPLLTRIFLPINSPIYDVTKTSIRILAVYTFLRSINESVMSYMAAVREMMLCNIYTVVVQLISPVLAMYIMGRLFGETGILLAYPVGELFALFVYVTIAWIRYRIKYGKGSLKQMLMLMPPAEEEVYSLEMDIFSLEDAIGLSRKTQDFCRMRGIDSRRSYFAALCTEEMVVNIVKHGFPESKNRHCSVRIIVDHDNLTLRYRDDCRYFNICERYKAMNHSDVVKNVGIRIVYASAKEVRYVNVLNTNTIILVL